jgi:hypothetical protein
MTREAAGVTGQEDKGYGECLDALWAIVGRTKLRMRVNGCCSKGTETTQGLTEGATTSPTLYIYNIDELSTAVYEEIESWESRAQREGLVQYSEVVLATMLFCDDVVLVAARQEAIEKMFTAARRWLKWDRSKLQPVKTKFMVIGETIAKSQQRMNEWAWIRDAGGRPHTIMAQDLKTGDLVEVEEVEDFKYVGTWISRILTDAVQGEKRKQQMSRVTGRLLAGGLAPGKGYTALLRYMAFGAVVTATLRYNTEVWARHKTRYEEMVVVWSALVKTVLGIHAYAQVKSLIIAGIHGTIPVNMQIEKQLLQYW